ncbi:MAG: maleylpyruvate isomerase family mycothiol-dependent enzyme [Acidimicrobiia bacterium]|nr:maleylpyruvate isomerase family mycothiol-dependent enzyme [Acidimicrobiia bacterium]
MPLPLPAERYIESIRADVDRFAAAIAAAPAAAVPCCPGWDNTALAGHLGDVYSFALAQLRSTDTGQIAAPDHGAKADAASWYRDNADQLLTTLAATDPDGPGWNWAGEPTRSFYFRRMACETAVHRVDAQRAAGDAEHPVDADIATDGIDEVFEVGMRFRIRGPNDEFPAGSLHLHRTDGDGEWLVRAIDGGIELTHEHAKGDAAVRGPASDLFLFLWGRGRGQAEVFGDEQVAEAWAAVAP